MVYNFLCKDEKTRRNIYLLLLKTSVWKEVRHFSVQCILTETTWLPTLIKENHECSNVVANILPADPPNPPTCTPDPVDGISR